MKKNPTLEEGLVDGSILHAPVMEGRLFLRNGQSVAINQIWSGELAMRPVVSYVGTFEIYGLIFKSRRQFNPTGFFECAAESCFGGCIMDMTKEMESEVVFFENNGGQLDHRFAINLQPEPLLIKKCSKRDAQGIWSLSDKQSAALWKQAYENLGIITSTNTEGGIYLTYDMKTGLTFPANHKSFNGPSWLCNFCDKKALQKERRRMMELLFKDDVSYLYENMGSHLYTAVGMVVSDEPGFNQDIRMDKVLLDDISITSLRNTIDDMVLEVVERGINYVLKSANKSRYVYHNPYDPYSDSKMKLYNDGFDCKYYTSGSL